MTVLNWRNWRRCIKPWQFGARFADGQAFPLAATEVTKSHLPLFCGLQRRHPVFDARIIRGLQIKVFLWKMLRERLNICHWRIFLKAIFFTLTVGEADLPKEEENDLSARDWFFKAIKKRKSVFLEAVLGTFMVSIFGLMSALYTMQVYDRVVPTNGFSTLWVLTIGVVLAVIFEFAMKLVRAQMVDRASKAIDIELSSVFFGKALDIRAEARPRTVGTFASQIRHFESVRNFMTSTTLFIMADAPFAFFFIFVIYLIAGPVALVPLVTCFLASLSVCQWSGGLKNTRRKIWRNRIKKTVC